MRLVKDSLAATRGDLVLPGEGAPGVSFALLQIHQSKTCGVAARHQAPRIDPQDVVRLLTAAFGKLNSSEPSEFSIEHFKEEILYAAGRAWPSNT